MKTDLFWASIGPIFLALTLFISNAFLFSVSALLCWVVFLLVICEKESRERKKERQRVEETHAFEEEIAHYRDALNTLRTDCYQQSLLLEAATTPQTEPKPDPLYLQLRKQFAEKTEVLNATRKELFYTENRLLALQKEKQLQELDPSSLELTLMRQLKEAEESSLTLEAEVEQLHEIIADLLKKKRTPSRSKKQDLLQSSFF